MRRARTHARTPSDATPVIDRASSTPKPRAGGARRLAVIPEIQAGMARRLGEVTWDAAVRSGRRVRAVTVVDVAEPDGSCTRFVVVSGGEIPAEHVQAMLVTGMSAVSDGGKGSWGA